MLKIPSMKVQELQGDQKKIMITLIREFSKDLCNITHLGLEATEEGITELINKGLAKIIHDEEQGIFYLTYYNFKTESYDKKEI
jgi:hypothetical protein